MSNFTATPDVSFMIRDLMALETHEKIMLDIDEEQLADRRAEELTIEQRNFDQELLQMQQDIDDDTEHFISAFESLDHNDSDTNDECYDRLNESRETYFRNRDLQSADRNNEPDSEDDDLLENTDTEDGADEILDLLQSNRQLTSLLSQHSRDIARLRDIDVLELLRTNTHLVALLSKQRKTIARLRARINTLGTLIPPLPSHDIGDSNTMMEAAFSLADSLASTPEMTLSSIERARQIEC